MKILSKSFTFWTLVAFFSLVALQWFPLTGIFLMMLGAPIWVGYMPHLVMLAIVIDLLKNKSPKYLWLIPVLPYVLYAGFYGAELRKIENLKQQVAQSYAAYQQSMPDSQNYVAYYDAMPAFPRFLIGCALIDSTSEWKCGAHLRRKTINLKSEPASNSVNQQTSGPKIPYSEPPKPMPSESEIRDSWIKNFKPTQP